MIKSFEEYIVNESNGAPLITVQMTIGDFFNKYYSCTTTDDYWNGVGYMMNCEWENEEDMQKCVDYVNKNKNKKIKVTLKKFSGSGQCDCVIDGQPAGIESEYNTTDFSASEFKSKLDALGIKYKIISELSDFFRTGRKMFGSSRL